MESNGLGFGVWGYRLRIKSLIRALKFRGLQVTMGPKVFGLRVWDLGLRVCIQCARGGCAF